MGPARFKKYQQYARGARSVLKVAKAIRKGAKRHSKPRARSSKGAIKTQYTYSSGGRTTASKCVKTNKPQVNLKTIRKVTHLDTVRKTQSFSILSSFGLQGYYQSPPLLNQAELKGVFEQAVQTNPDAELENKIYPTDRERGLWLESVATKTTFSNASPGNVNMEIYDLIAKDDYFGAAINNEPVYCYRDGLKYLAGPNFVEEVPEYLGSRLMDSAMFKQKYRILKKTVVEMHTGANHVHHFKFNYQGQLASSKMEQMDGYAYSSLRGITTFQMVFINGMPVDDEPTYATGTVTMDRGKIIAVKELTIRTRISKLKGKHIAYQGVLAPTMTAAVGQNPDGRGVFNTVANSVLDTAWS